MYIPYPHTVTIASGQTVSGALELNQATLLALRTPATLTGTAFSFQVSDDGTTYVALNDPDTGAAISMIVAASKGYSIDAALFVGWRYVKVVSNAAEGADRTITLVSRIVN